MADIKIVPTYLRIQVTNAHKISAPVKEADKIILKLKSYFNFKGISGGKRVMLYEEIMKGNQIGNMVLPYLCEKHTAIWEKGVTQCNLGRMQITDRVMEFSNPRIVTDEQLNGENIWAETDVQKSTLIIHSSEDGYNAIEDSDQVYKVLIRDFYENKDVLFDGIVKKLPVPGIDKGSFVFADGSRVGTTSAGKKEKYTWGSLCSKDNLVCAITGSGESEEMNAAAEQNSCRESLNQNPCSWGKDDDITVFFDCVNNAYPILGWFTETDYSTEIKKLGENFKSLTFYHIDAHTGVVGNELADSLANIDLREERYKNLGEQGGVKLDQIAE